MKITPEQRAFWNDNGYLAVENVIPPEMIAADKARFEWLCGHWDGPEAKRLNVIHEPGLPPEKRGPATVRVFSDLVEHEPVFHAHALHAGLLDLIEGLIGTPFSVFETQALLKPPSIGSPKPPHQDNAYFQVQPADAVITCWCALDDATVENGCMMYIPGSHKFGLIEHKWIEGTPHQVPVGVDLSKPAYVPLKAGGVVFHHSLTLHMSGPNRSKGWRRAFISHCCRDDADVSKAVRGATRGVPARG